MSRYYVMLKRLIKKWVAHTYTPLLILTGLVALALIGLGATRIGWWTHTYLQQLGTATPYRLSDIRFVTPTPPPPLHLRDGGRYQAEEPLLVSTPRPYYADANEMGQVLVLEYHRIAYPETRYQRTPENFRSDLRRLHQAGYYPTNFLDMLQGFPDVPPGKKPIVLTFDDSDLTQFNVLPNNALDTDSALGIILAQHKADPVNWPTRATFFVLGNDSNRHYKIFGQPKWVKAKLTMLVDLGMEIGSHTVTHSDLSAVTAERIYWELAISQHVIEELVPGYEVQSLSVPFGGFPYTLDFLKQGNWGDFDYSYTGNAAAWGGASLSPHHPDFEPYKVARLEVTATSLDHWLNHFAENPHHYYTADGDPTRLTYPRLEVMLEATPMID